ncbi:MAG: hypothetical protein LBD59_09095 [Prevotellaceae bacterium]|jgi:hypothetical protein|nr:hypothetical protein [Prevotellaceae bacterium]
MKKLFLTLSLFWAATMIMQAQTAKKRRVFYDMKNLLKYSKFLPNYFVNLVLVAGMALASCSKDNGGIDPEPEKPNPDNEKRPAYFTKGKDTVLYYAVDIKKPIDADGKFIAARKKFEMDCASIAEKRKNIADIYAHFDINMNGIKKIPLLYAEGVYALTRFFWYGSAGASDDIKREIFLEGGAFYYVPKFNTPYRHGHANFSNKIEEADVYYADMEKNGETGGPFGAAYATTQARDGWPQYGVKVNPHYSGFFDPNTYAVAKNARNICK